MVQKIVTSENTNEGYDALRDCYVDMIEEGEIGGGRGRGAVNGRE